MYGDPVFIAKFFYSADFCFGILVISIIQPQKYFFGSYRFFADSSYQPFSAVIHTAYIFTALIGFGKYFHKSFYDNIVNFVIIYRLFISIDNTKLANVFRVKRFVRKSYRQIKFIRSCRSLVKRYWAFFIIKVQSNKLYFLNIRRFSFIAECCRSPGTTLVSYKISKLT